MVPEQQVAGVLAGQADAPGAVEIRDTVLAQRVAVSTVSHEVEELLFLAAGSADPTRERDVRVTGEAVGRRRPTALPAGWVAFCASTFLVEVAIWALREALPIQQHMGRPADCAVLWALSCTAEAGLVAGFTQSSALQVEVGSAWGQTFPRGDLGPRKLLDLQALLWLRTPGALRALRTHTSQAGGMTGFADCVVSVEAFCTAGQTVALMQSLGVHASCAVRGCGPGAAGT